MSNLWKVGSPYGVGPGRAKKESKGEERKRNIPNPNVPAPIVTGVMTVKKQVNHNVSGALLRVTVPDRVCRMGI